MDIMNTKGKGRGRETEFLEMLINERKIEESK